MIPLPGIRGAFKNSATISSLYLSYAKLSAQTVCIDHIYINCWSPVYSWSVFEKTDNQDPPPPTNTRICVCVGGVWLTVFTLLTTCRPRTSNQCRYMYDK